MSKGFYTEQRDGYIRKPHVEKDTGLSKEQRKEERRKAQIPTPRAYNVKLPNGSEQKVKATFGQNKVSLATVLNDKKVSCTFEFRPALILRKVRVFGKVVKKNGTPLLVSVPLPATHAILTIDGKKYTSVSYCKPPDVFSRQTGTKFALRYALRQAAEASAIASGDFETLVRVFLTKPPKMSQIRHAQKLASKTPVETPEGC